LFEGGGKVVFILPKFTCPLSLMIEKMYQKEKSKGLRQKKQQGLVKAS